MECLGLLYPERELDLSLLHFYTSHRMAESLERFRQALMHRGLRTEGHKTPSQLWIQGRLMDPRWEPQYEVK